MSEVTVSLGATRNLALLCTVGGFAAGFSLAERVYATDQQQKAVRTAVTASLAAVVLATALLAARRISA